MRRIAVYYVVYAFLVFSAVMNTSCRSSRTTVTTKFHPQQLQQDLHILWNTYQKAHPSYDWYTPSDSVDARFRTVQASLTDSLTEAEFRLRLSWAVAAIRCGHTAVLAPKSVLRDTRRQPAPSFPLSVRVTAHDSLVVWQTSGPDRDSIPRGSIIQMIDSVPAGILLQQMRDHISVDGYNLTFSNAMVNGSFQGRFRWMYGLQPFYHIQWTDSAGRLHQTRIRSTIPPHPDSLRRRTAQAAPRPAGPPAYGFMDIDSSSHTAWMRLNSFSGAKVGRFIRRSFKTIHQLQVQHLVLDLRANSGGRIRNSALLGKYLAHHPFTVADSISARGFRFPYPKYVQGNIWFRLFGWVLASRQADGRWHMGSMERKEHVPKKKRHFSGPLYVLTGGRTFSASVLLLHYLEQRPHTKRVGEETGGGARGNSAVLTPEIRLPNTGIRATLPLFRIVTNAALPHNGRGILPHLPAIPTSASIRQGADLPAEAVRNQIRGAGVFMKE